MKLSKTEFKYSLKELLLRAGYNGNIEEIDRGYGCLGINFFYDEMPRQTNYSPTITFKKSSPQDWDRLVNPHTSEIKWFDVKELMPPDYQTRESHKIPILFWGKHFKSEDKPIIFSKEKVVFNVDFVAAVFFMLSRWEETVVETRDKYDRFPAHASLAFRHNFLDQPIVDEYALILLAWIRYLLPGWKPVIKNPSLLLTHDIDFIRKYANPLKLTTTLFYQIRNRSNLAELISSIKTFAKEIRHPNSSIFLKGISKLAEISRKNDLKSIFFFQAADPSKNDSGYTFDDQQLQSEIHRIQDYDFEIGLHPSYDSYDDYEKLMSEKRKLEQNIRQDIKLVRQHYLRFKVPLTWQIQLQAGFKADFSLGYPEVEGFRCGTCHPFHPYDLINKEEMRILEIPLIVMDRTFMTYRKMKPKQAFKRISEIYRRCLSVNGTFSLLWHNSSLLDENKEWGDEYQSFIENLSPS